MPSISQTLLSLSSRLLLASWVHHIRCFSLQSVHAAAYKANNSLPRCELLAVDAHTLQLIVLAEAANESALEEQEPPTRADLIAASDVFLYMGDLQPVLSAAHAFLAPEGLLAFTLERITDSSSSSSSVCSAAASATAAATASSDGTVYAPTDTADTTGSASASSDSKVCRGWMLQKSGRFAHTQQYVEQLAVEAGFTVVHYAEHSPRTEGGKAIPGHLFVLQTTTATTSDSSNSERATDGTDDDELLHWH
jgi:hypothetical protein